jgi:hypothetical protein
MHWGDRPKLGAVVPVAAADAPLISDYINKDIKIDMCWGECWSDVIDEIALTRSWGIGSANSTATSTIDMHWQLPTHH